MKKTFECGHRGLGKYCHRCEQEAKAIAKAAEQKAKDTKARRQKAFDRDPIDLRGLPNVVVRGARQLIKALARGDNWIDLGGKKLDTGANRYVRFPLPMEYRLVCERGAQGFKPLEVMTHESYNKRWR